MSLFEVKKPGYLAFLGIPIGVAVAEYMRSQIPTGQYPLNPDAEARVKKIAENMGIIPEVTYTATNSKQTLLANGSAMGSNFSWSRPTVSFSSPEPTAFVCAHELSHIQKNRDLKRLGISLLSIAGILASNLSVPAKFVTLLALPVIERMTLSRLQEQEADLNACSYLTAKEIAEGVHFLNRSICQEAFSIHHDLESWKIALPDTHPPDKTRIEYLTDEYFKKPLQPVSIEIAGNEVQLSEQVAKQLRESIQKSSKRHSLLGVEKIEVIPTAEKDNVQFCFAERKIPYTVNLNALSPTDDLAAGIQALKITDEVVKTPHFYIAVYHAPENVMTEIIQRLTQKHPGCEITCRKQGDGFEVKIFQTDKAT